MKKNQDTNPAFASNYQRITRLMLAAICIIILTHLGFNTSFHGHEILANQSQMTATSLSKQFALSASPYVEKNEQTALVRLVNNFAQDRFIQSAAIFDKHGKLLAQSEHATLYSERLSDPISMPGISQISSPVINDIIADGQRIGFSRITFSHPAATKIGHEYLHDVSKQVAVMMIVSCILTWVLARKIKRWQVKRYIRKSEQDDE